MTEDKDSLTEWAENIRLAITFLVPRCKICDDWLTCKKPQAEEYRASVSRGLKT